MKKFTLKGKIFPIIIWTSVLIWTVVLLSMFLWAFLSSVKDIGDFRRNPMGLPDMKYGWKFSNYVTAINSIQYQINGVTYRFQHMLVNSIVFSVGNAVASVVTACVAAYIIAKYNYIGWVQRMWIIVLLTNYLPVSASLASNIKLLKDLGLFDSMIGNILWSCGAFGSVFLIYYATWKSIPWEYAEAAFIDGAGHFRTMVTIMIPMTLTIFGVLCLSQFILKWNDYMTPILYLPSYPTISFGAWQFQFSTDPQTALVPVQLAGLLVIAFPVLIIFLIFKNKLMGSLTMGGLKG